MSGFVEWVQLQQNGGLVLELDAALEDLVQDVVDLRKSGELVLSVKVKPATATARGALNVSCAVNSKPPKPERGEQVWFADEDGHLTRNDPRQPQIPGVVTSD